MDSSHLPAGMHFTQQWLVGRQACEDYLCFTTSGRSVSRGDPFQIVNILRGFLPGTRPPARMHFTLQWQVCGQAGMTEWVGFETASFEKGGSPATLCKGVLAHAGALD